MAPRVACFRHTVPGPDIACIRTRQPQGARCTLEEDCEGALTCIGSSPVCTETP